MNWIAWALLSAVFAALTAIFAKIGIAGIDSNLATAVRTTVILVITWGMAASFGNVAELGAYSRRTWVFLILSGLATGASWLCYFRALQLGEASRVAPLDKLSVVFVVVFAALFLQEKITWHQVIGGALIAGGAVILARY
ncbi:MAG TPA: EamA family transporter [Lacipirellulaceae bacterium]|jgi:transporter family protein|nr:EamA family transporter [Lacipirellulaceae bacterium]